MQTSDDTVWVGVPSAGDQLFFPSVSFGPGGAEGTVTLLVVGGRRDGAIAPTLIVYFQTVVSVCGYSETAYWSLAEARHRPRHFLNVIRNSPLAARIKGRLPWYDAIQHYLVCGGDMCCEVVATDYSIAEYQTEAEAVAVLAAHIA